MVTIRRRTLLPFLCLIACIAATDHTASQPTEHYLVVMTADEVLSCSGCLTTVDQLTNPDGTPLPNDQVLECPNGVSGATIVASNAQTPHGNCRHNNRVDEPGCLHTGDCRHSVDLEIVFANNSCFTAPVWVTAPGLPGAQPLIGTWDYGTLSDQAACSDKETLGLGARMDVYADQALTQRIGVYGFRVKCSKCQPD